MVSKTWDVPGRDLNSAIPPRQARPVRVNVAPLLRGPYNPPGLFAKCHCSTRPPGHVIALASCQPTLLTLGGGVNPAGPLDGDSTVATSRLPAAEGLVGSLRPMLSPPCTSPLFWASVKPVWLPAARTGRGAANCSNTILAPTAALPAMNCRRDPSHVVRGCRRPAV